MEKRVSKGWTHVRTNTNFSKTDSSKKNRNARHMTDTMRSKSYEDLKKAADKAYEVEEVRKTNLLQAYEDKKLKSKTLIKEAQGIKKERAKAAEKAAKKKEQAG